MKGIGKHLICILQWVADCIAFKQFGQVSLYTELLKPHVLNSPWKKLGPISYILYLVIIKACVHVLHYVPKFLKLFLNYFLLDLIFWNFIRFRTHPKLILRNFQPDFHFGTVSIMQINNNVKTISKLWVKPLYYSY